MVRKRRGEEHSDLADQTAKRSRNCFTDLAKGKYFVVRSNHGGEHCIFNDYERCKPYFNRKDVSVLAFDTLKDAEHFAEFPVPCPNVAVDSSFGKGTGGLNDSSGIDLSPQPDASNAEREQSDDQICKGTGVQDNASDVQLIQLPDSEQKEASNQVTVYANGTTCISRDAKMGFGVYFEDESPHNLAGCVEGSVSSQRADLKAALEAIKIIFHSGMIAADGDIDLCVNSNYVRNGFESWMQRWKKNGWRNANKGAIKNVDLWKEVDSTLGLLKEARVRVKATIASGSAGAFSAGRLAEQAMREE